MFLISWKEAWITSCVFFYITLEHRDAIHILHLIRTFHWIFQSLITGWWLSPWARVFKMCTYLYLKVMTHELFNGNKSPSFNENLLQRIWTKWITCSACARLLRLLFLLSQMWQLFTRTLDSIHGGPFCHDKFDKSKLHSCDVQILLDPGDIQDMLWPLQQLCMYNIYELPLATSSFKNSLLNCRQCARQVTVNHLQICTMHTSCWSYKLAQYTTQSKTSEHSA